MARPDRSEALMVLGLLTAAVTVMASAAFGVRRPPELPGPDGRDAPVGPVVQIADNSEGRECLVGYDRAGRRELACGLSGHRIMAYGEGEVVLLQRHWVAGSTAYAVVDVQAGVLTRVRGLWSEEQRQDAPAAAEGVDVTYGPGRLLTVEANGSVLWEVEADEGYRIEGVARADGWVALLDNVDRILLLEETDGRGPYVLAEEAGGSRNIWLPSSAPVIPR